LEKGGNSRRRRTSGLGLEHGSQKGKRRTFSDLVDVNVRDLKYEDHDAEVNEFEEHSKDFFAHLASKNRSKHTISFYRSKLNNWRRELEALGLSLSVHEISRKTIEEFVYRHVHEKGLKYSSAANTLRGVKAFANFLERTGVIETHGFHEFVIGESKADPIQTFSEAQIARLLAQPNPEFFTGVRDYTIILLLLETGVRLRELCDLRLSDVDLDDRLLRVLGKNQSFRYVPYQAHFANVLRQYLKVRGDSETDALFITVDDDPIKGRTVQDALKKYAKAANISGVRVSPHTFRHTFAKMYVQNGGDPFSLQKILGHSTMDMVRKYVNMFGSELDEAHRKFSPLNNFFKRQRR